MAIQIGKRRELKDLVDALLECHDRIRRFASVTQRLATVEGATAEDIAEAAASARRYFKDALPQHVADEDQSILPRLNGRDAAVDRELAVMEREHRGHEPTLSRLIELFGMIASTPSQLPSLAPELRQLAGVLLPDFEGHLAREEQIIFPAIRVLLSPAEQQAISDEMLRRRQVS